MSFPEAWWDVLGTYHMGSEPIHAAAVDCLRRLAFRRGATTYERTAGGVAVGDRPIIDVALDLAGKFDLRVIEHKRCGVDGNGNDEVVLGSPDTAVCLRYTRGSDLPRSIGISVNSLDEALTHRITAAANVVLSRAQAGNGKAYVMASRNGRMSLRDIGTGAVPIERGNYAPEILASFDHVAADLVSPAPCGRLIVLEGPPRCGKTFMVRALMAAAPRVTFVIVPASMLAALAAPDLIPTIIDEVEDGRNIVLIAEDADSVLVPRQADNINGISALLNMADGIVGRLLDMRVIVSTNAKKVEMDPALLGAGRLCRRIHVDVLSKMQANEVHMRLCGKPWPGIPNAVERPALAQVYRSAAGAPLNDDADGTSVLHR